MTKIQKLVGAVAVALAFGLAQSAFAYSTPSWVAPLTPGSAEAILQTQLVAQGKTALGASPTATAKDMAKALRSVYGAHSTNATMLAQLVGAAAACPSQDCPTGTGKYVETIFKLDNKAVSPVLTTEAAVKLVVGEAVNQTGTSQFLSIAQAVGKSKKGVFTAAIAQTLFTDVQSAVNNAGIPAEADVDSAVVALAKADKMAAIEVVTRAVAAMPSRAVEVATGAAKALKNGLVIAAAINADPDPDPDPEDPAYLAIPSAAGLSGTKLSIATMQVRIALRAKGLGKAAVQAVTASWVGNSDPAGIGKSGAKLMKDIVGALAAANPNHSNNIVEAAILVSTDAAKAAPKAVEGALSSALLTSRNSNGVVDDAASCAAAIAAQAITAARTMWSGNHKATVKAVNKIAAGAIKTLLKVDFGVGIAKTQTDPAAHAGASTGLTSAVTPSNTTLAGSNWSTAAASTPEGRLFAVITGMAKAANKDNTVLAAIAQAAANAVAYIQVVIGSLAPNASDIQTAIANAMATGSGQPVGNFSTAVSNGWTNGAGGNLGIGAAGVVNYTYHNGTGSPVTDLAGF